MGSQPAFDGLKSRWSCKIRAVLPFLGARAPSLAFEKLISRQTGGIFSNNSLFKTRNLGF